MNGTDRARRSDALYHGELNRRGLCDMIAILESDLERQECEMTYEADTGSWRCLSCQRAEYVPDRSMPRYCRFCGRKAVKWEASVRHKGAM